MLLSYKEAHKEIDDFCNKYNVYWNGYGHVGFERPCVGLLSSRDEHAPYLDFNPVYIINNTIWQPDKFTSTSFYPPRKLGVIDAYHKHDCFVILVHNGDYRYAIRQLGTWIKNVESKGDLEIAEYTIPPYGSYDSGVRVALRYTNKYVKFKDCKRLVMVDNLPERKYSKSETLSWIDMLKSLDT